MHPRPQPSEANKESRGLSAIDAAQLFRACFEGNPSLMAIATLAEGRQVDVNKAWLNALGYERREIIGKTNHDVNIWADPDDRKKIIDRLEKEGFVSDGQTVSLRQS